MTHEIIPGFTAPEDDGQTPLDADEARGLLPGWIATRADLNVAEEQNIADGMIWGSRAIRRKPVLVQDFLRQLHKQMFGRVWAWAGQYRDTERNIGVPPHSISTELKKLLDDALAWDEFNTYPIAARVRFRGAPDCRATRNVVRIWMRSERPMRLTTGHFCNSFDTESATAIPPGPAVPG